MFRHEWKHEISYADFLAVRQRLLAVAKLDDYAGSQGYYEIKSLYFDNLEDKALREKLYGVNGREKFRLRIYNGRTDPILLEKKSKIQNLCEKTQAKLTSEEVRLLLSGETEWMMEDERRALVRELYCKMKTQGLRPKTIVEYRREPFVYAPGNVRVTLDYNIRTGLGNIDFLNPKAVTVKAGDAPIIMEVKWDAYLPSIIKDAVQLTGCRTGTFSKYAACRIYG